jgi:competence protein ComEA
VSLTASESRALLVSGLLIVLATVARATLGRTPADSWESSLRPVSADSLLAGARAHERGRARAARPLRPGERVDVNRASEHELERLPGVGPALAREMLHYREVHGAFVWVDDLRRVPGVGPALLERLRDRLTLPARPPVTAPGAGAPVPHGIATVPSATPSAPGALAAEPAGVVDLNRASAEELQRLPGIGARRAALILALRQARGRFHSVDELLDVPGIGPKTLARLRPYVGCFP